MENVLDLEAWREILVRTGSELGTSVAHFVPRLVGALLILGGGYLLSRLVEAVVVRVLRRVGVDRAAARLRVGELLEHAEVEASTSQILAKLVFWMIFLTFLVSGIEALGLQAVTSTINRLIAFIPGMIGALLMGVAGLLLARFAGGVVSSAAAAAGIAKAARFGFATQALFAGMVIVLALDQLGIGTDVLVVPFSVALAVAGFGVGLAIALGARPVVTHILAGHFLKQAIPRDSAVEVAGRRGVVELVGPVCTVLRDGERSWSIPNAQLLDEVVTR